MPATLRAPSGVPIDGNALRRKRQHQGLTITQLADKTPYGFSYISRIERGHYATISPRAFIAISEALGLTTEDEREQIVDRTVERPERKPRGVAA